VSHSIEVIPAVAAYFGADVSPVIEQEYRVSRGWVVTGFNKRVSRAWLRKLRREGVTSVALRHGARLADFTVTELLSSGF